MTMVKVKTGMIEGMPIDKISALGDFLQTLEKLNIAHCHNILIMGNKYYIEWVK